MEARGVGVAGLPRPGPIPAGHSTVAWLSPDWPSRYAAAGAHLVALADGGGIWVSVDLLTARSVCSGSRATPGRGVLSNCAG